MGMLGPGAFYAEAVKAALARAGLKVATVDVTKKSGLFEQVGSVLHEVERFTSCIVLAVGAGGEEEQVEFAENVSFRKRLVAWVERGGRLIVQGERGGWPEWFDKTWEHDDYRRTTHECRAKSVDDVHWCKWYPEATGSVTSSINVKAVMMRGVPTEEILFGTTSSSVSHSNVFFMAGMPLENGLAARAIRAPSWLSSREAPRLSRHAVAIVAAAFLLPPSVCGAKHFRRMVGAKIHAWWWWWWWWWWLWW